jgi:hypothetical protein
MDFIAMPTVTKYILLMKNRRQNKEVQNPRDINKQGRSQFPIEKME